MITVTVLGSGTSQGVPMIGCKCDVCLSTDTKDKRLRSSILIENSEGDTLIVDVGPDFRYQMLRENVENLDGILLTHDHKDHIGGIDDVRAFNYVLHRHMDIYAEQYVLDTVKKDYAYAFVENKYPGVPDINLHEIKNLEPFSIKGFDIIPIRGMHHKLPVLAFRIGKFCYMTDMNQISAHELDKIKGVDTLIINSVRYDKHISHFSLSDALEVIAEVAPKRAYITHISHQLNKYEILSKELPEGVMVAYDKLKITI